ncbi:MAG TPA: hypothetical protein VFN67_10010 [Polyangiales bacterium]|nr:hypothetical protein [Polyangiales bacterium]
MIRKRRAFARRGTSSRFGLLSVAAWMSLMGFSAAPPPSAAEAPPCTIAQKKPLYVGFADDMSLENFEDTAAASVDIVREVKHWACSNPETANLAVPSLQLALARGSVRLERVQFRDATHAHVLLADAKRPRWRLDVTQGDDSWRVTHSRVAKASELPRPDAQRSAKR